jgi:hypothetical protein
VQLPHLSSTAHVVHQVESISFAANKSHEPHPATPNLTVVYCTSTTAFNTCFVASLELASKALTLSLSFFSLLTTLALRPAFPIGASPTGLEDTRPNSASIITFLAPFHSFGAFTWNFPLLI